MRKLIKGVAVFAVFANVSGCALLGAPPEIPTEIRVTHPTNLPNPVITNFTEALACMDDLMLINQVTPIYIASPQITNFTSDRSISSGSTEMLITAMSKMASRSGGIRYVSFGPEVQSILTLQGAHPNNKTFRAPDFFIRGGVTEFNKSAWNGQAGTGGSVEIDPGEIKSAGLSFLVQGKKQITASNSRDAAMGTMTMDLNAGFVSNLQIIPGISSSNTLALENRTGKAVTGDLSLASIGLSYSLSENISKDFNQILRSLIEVGLIEIVGKIQGVPYWRCLSNAGLVEAKDKELRIKFITHNFGDTSEIISTVQTALTDLKFYSGEINGTLDFSTKQALQFYQQHMGILASGNLTYETFRMMNIYTPARTTPYAPWWQNHSEVERAISIPKVAVPAPPDATPSAATSSPQPDAALAKNPPITEGKAKLSEKNGKLANAQTSTGTGVRPVMNAAPEAWKMFGPLTQQRLKAGQAWVAQAGINRWFVQLVHTEANQFAGIESFIQKAESALGQPNVHAYFVNESGVNYVVVTYGDFSSEADATAAINNLPREVRVNRPYSRQLINLLGGNPGTVVN